MNFYQRISVSIVLYFTLISPLLAMHQARNFHYHSAGVVPYAVDNNQVWILVGTEPARHNQAFDFGGKKDPEDKNNPAFTGAREGTEELLFMYDESDQEFIRLANLFTAHGRNFNLYKANSVTYPRLLDKIQNGFNSFSNGYMTYFVKISYRPQIPDMFENRRQKFSKNIPYAWMEKNQLYWIKLSDLINTLKNVRDFNSVWVPAQSQKRGTVNIQLFPSFAQSLSVALHNGTLARLK